MSQEGKYDPRTVTPGPYRDRMTNQLDDAVGRKLRSVEAIEAERAEQLLELEDDSLTQPAE